MISLRSTSVSYYEYVSNIFERVNWIGCIPSGEYQLILYSDEPVQVSYTMKIKGNVIRKYYNPKLISEEKYSFSTPITPKIIFNYPNTQLIIGQYVSISPKHTGAMICDKYSLFETLLPNGLVINQETGSIEGIPTTVTETSSYISCEVNERIIGVVSAFISIIGPCPSKSVPFSIVINSGSVKGDKLSIVYTDNRDMEMFSLNGVISSQTIYYSYCYSAEGYKISISNSNEWPTGLSITTYINNAKKIYESPQIISQNISSNDIELWEYTTSDVTNWYKTETAWSRYAIGNFPLRQNSHRSWYFKRNFYFNGDKSLMYYILHIKHNGGMVVYVNGEVVHRFKVENGWRHNTVPMDTYGFTGQVKILTYNLRNGINTIAAVIYSSIGQEVFNITISYEKGISECREVSLSDMTRFYEDIGWSSEEQIDKLLNGNIIDKYGSNRSKYTIGLLFNSNINYPVNRLDTFVANDCPGRDWWTIKVSSMYFDRANNGTNAVPMNYVSLIATLQLDNPVTGNRNDPYFMYSLDFKNIEGHQATHFDITNRGEGGCAGMAISELRMHSCKPSYCNPTEKVAQSGYEGTIEEIKCFHSSNKIKYRCNNKGNWVAESDETICETKSECTDLDVLFSLEILGGPLQIILNDNTKRLISEYRTGDKDILKNYNLCLKDETYEIVLITNSVNTISYSLLLDGSILRTADLLTFSFIHKISITPGRISSSISLENKELYLGVTYYLYPSQINGKGCTSFQMDMKNSLPQTMSFNTENGGIIGKLKNQFTKELTLNCVNGVNTYPATVKYVARECPAYSVLYELKIESKANGKNLIVILESSNGVLYSILGVSDEKTYIFSGCLQYSSFKLRLSSNDGRGWSIGTKVTFEYNGESKFYSNTGSVNIITEEDYEVVESDPKWMYSDLVLDDEWNNKFDSSIWQRSELSKLPRVSVTIRYYKIIYDMIVDYEMLETLLVRTTFEGGMKVYVNGNEIMSKDMPLSQILKKNYEFEISGNVLRKGINYIGVEVHRSIEPGESKDDTFRMQIKTIISSQKCVTKTLFSTMIPKMNVETNLIGTADPNTIDLNYSTEFIENTQSKTLTGKEIVYKYPSMTRKTFNEYSVVTRKDCPNNDLISWIVHGDYLDDSTFEIMNEVEDSQMIGEPNTSPGVGRSALYKYKINNSYKSYSSYKFEMKSIKSITNSVNSECVGKYGFSEFYVSNCKELTCKSSDGYSQTRVGSSGFKECEEGKIGRKESLCTLVEGIPSWSKEKEDCNLISKSISYGTTTLEFSMGIYKEYPATLGEGEKGYLEIVGNKPVGIEIDEITGKIYGKPSTFDSGTIYVKYQFMSGINIISQELTLKLNRNCFKLYLALYCLAITGERSYPETIVFSTATIPCPCGGAGNYSRTCSMEGSEAIWEDEKNNCGK